MSGADAVPSLSPADVASVSIAVSAVAGAAAEATAGVGTAFDLAAVGVVGTDGVAPAFCAVDTGRRKIGFVPAAAGALAGRLADSCSS